MVKFNPEFQAAPAQDWTRESQGRGADKGLATLFAGVGDAVQSYADTSDKLIRQSISLQASDAANQAAEQPDMFKPDTPNTPQAIRDAVTQTGRLKQAYQQGAISDLDYMSRVDMRLKRLKSQYPGYRDVIDQEFSGAMGSSLANDMRREQLQQADKASREGNEEAKNEREWREAHGGELYRAFGPDLGAGKSFDEVKSAAYKQQAEQQQFQYDQQKITQMEKGSQLQKEQAKKNMTNQVSAGLDAAVRITIGGGDSLSMNDAIDKFIQPGSEGGTQISDAERAQLVAGLDHAERTVMTQVQQMFTGNLSSNKDGDYISYASILTDQKDRDDILALPKARFAIMRQALFDGDTGALKQAAASSDYRIEQKRAELALGPQGGAYNTMAALKKMGVDLSLFQGSNKAIELGDKTLQYIIDQFPKDAAALGDQGKSFGEVVKSLEDGGVTDPAAYRGALNNVASVLVNPQMPDAAFVNEGKAFFNKHNMDLLEKFTEPNAPDLFKKFVNPVITQRVMKSGDQKLIEGYRQWAFTQFGRVTRAGMQELKGAANYEINGQITFDGERFVAPPQKDQFPGMHFPPGANYTTGASDKVQAGVNTINEYLGGIKPLLESQGMSVADFAQRQFGSLSFSGVEPQGQAIVDALTTWFKGEQEQATEAGKAGAYPPAKPKATGLAGGIQKSAAALGVDAEALATAISYETAGTFNPWKRGPTTKYGQHRGLIQWGEPQRKQYGITEDMTPEEQMTKVTQYLKDRGVKPGMGLMEIYSAINAGSADHKYWNRSDEAAGGAWGTVMDKVLFQMEGHKKKARELLAS